MFHQIQKPSKPSLKAKVYAPILQLRNLQEQAPGLSTWFYQAVNIQGIHPSFGQERNQNFIYCALIPAAITWMFPKIGVGPQNGGFIMENLIKMHDLGVPLFLETPTSERLIFLSDRMFIGAQLDAIIPYWRKKGFYCYVSLQRLTSRADLSSVRFITAVNIVFTDFRKVALSPAAGASATPWLFSRFQAARNKGSKGLKREELEMGKFSWSPRPCTNAEG